MCVHCVLKSQLLVLACLVCVEESVICASVPGVC